MPKLLLYLAGPFAGFSWKFIRHNVDIPIYFDNSRAKNQLDINFNTAEQALKDQADQVIKDELIK
jgi:hypothetical protein